MKVVFFAVVAVGGLLTTMPASAAKESFEVDPNHTFPHFKISHLGFSTMRGRFNQTSGRLTMDREADAGTVEVVIDAASIDTGMKKRDDHLRSPDFLNVVEFPEIVYKSTKVKFTGESGATVEGNLTIMGTTRPVTLDVERIHCGIHPMDPEKKKYVCGFEASAKIKRSDFGVNYALPAIGDEMALSFEVEAIRN